MKATDIIADAENEDKPGYAQVSTSRPGLLDRFLNKIAPDAKSSVMLAAGPMGIVGAKASTCATIILGGGGLAAAAPALVSLAVVSAIAYKAMGHLYEKVNEHENKADMKATQKAAQPAKIKMQTPGR